MVSVFHKFRRKIRWFLRVSIVAIIVFFAAHQFLISSRITRKLAYPTIDMFIIPTYNESFVVNVTINNNTTAAIINMSHVSLKDGKEEEPNIKTTKTKWATKDNNIATDVIPMSTGFLKDRERHENKTTKTKGGGREEEEGDLHVVVSYCSTPIGWIWRDYLHNRSYKSVTIITKCDIPILPEDFPPPLSLQRLDLNSNQTGESPPLLPPQQKQPLVQVVSLPNVGRCDHSYAFWIAMVLGKEEKSMKDNFQLLHSNHNNNNNNRSNNPFQSIPIGPKDYVIFMKDNDNSYRANIEDEIPLKDMFDRTKDQGMACASAVNEKQKYHNSWTNWAHRSVMWTFEMKRYAQNYNDTNSSNREEKSSTKNVGFRSIQRPMGEWIRYLSAYYKNVNDLKNVSTTLYLSGMNKVLSDEYFDVYSDVDEIGGFYYNSSRNLQIPAENDTKWTKNYNKLDLVPICFGGRFMARWGQLSSEDAPIQNWSVITKALSRGDNIEEGHYMERWWADILSWSSYSSSLLIKNDMNYLSSEKRHAEVTLYSEEKLSRQSGEVLTQSEQKRLLRLKLKHMTVHHPISYPYAGLLILDAKKVQQQEGWDAMRKARKFQKQEEARGQAEKVRKENEMKANWAAIRQAVASTRTNK